MRRVLRFSTEQTSSRLTECARSWKNEQHCDNKAPNCDDPTLGSGNMKPAKLITSGFRSRETEFPLSEMPHTIAAYGVLGIRKSFCATELV